MNRKQNYSKFKPKTTVTTTSMEKQIVSMLKGVIIDDIDENQSSIDYDDIKDELKDTIFNHDDNVSDSSDDIDNFNPFKFDESESTNANSNSTGITSLSQITFSRDQDVKSLSTKLQNPPELMGMMNIYNNNQNNQSNTNVILPMFRRSSESSFEINPFISNFNNSLGTNIFDNNQILTTSSFLNTSTISNISNVNNNTSIMSNNNNNNRNSYCSNKNNSNGNGGINKRKKGYALKNKLSTPQLCTFSFDKINQQRQQNCFYNRYYPLQFKPQFQPSQSNIPLKTNIPNITSQNPINISTLTPSNVSLNKSTNVTLSATNVLNVNGIIIDDPIAIELEKIISQYNTISMEVYFQLQNSFPFLIKNQQSSRLCQHYIEQTPKEVIHLIFLELSEQMCQFLLDPYANYFCLKLFYYLSQNDRLIFLNNICPYILNLSTNKIATYPIQCIIEHLNNKQEEDLIFYSVFGNIMSLSVDLYGTHVVEKVLSSLEYEQIKPIIQFVLDNFMFLVNNANGLCLVKKVIVIEYKRDFFPRLKQEITNASIVLIQNPFGNYALQTCIDLWNENDIEDIALTFKGRCALLSVQKYSSNVIERCIEKSNRFVKEFITEVFPNDSSVSSLMKNNYGNYVIQTALKVSSLKEQSIIVGALSNNLSQLNDKKLLNKWKSIISSYSIVDDKDK